MAESGVEWIEIVGDRDTEFITYLASGIWRLMPELGSFSIAKSPPFPP